jgi:hypothetical protein
MGKVGQLVIVPPAHPTPELSVETFGVEKGAIEVEKSCLEVADRVDSWVG